MSEELQIPEATREETEYAIGMYRAMDGMKRQYLLWMFEHRCHKVTNYGSFELFCQNVLNLAMSENSIRQLLRYARTERTLLGAKCYLKVTFSEPIAIEPAPKKYPQGYLEQLSRLETDADKLYIHNQIEGLTAENKGQNLVTVAKRLVEAHINRTKPVEEPQESTAVALGDTESAFVAENEETYANPNKLPVQPYKEKEPVILFDDEDPFPFDLPEAFFPTWIEVTNTLLTWLQNEQVDGNAEDKEWVIVNMKEMMEWIR